MWFVGFGIVQLWEVVAVVLGMCMVLIVEHPLQVVRNDGDFRLFWGEQVERARKFYKL